MASFIKAPHPVLLKRLTQAAAMSALFLRVWSARSGRCLFRQPLSCRWPSPPKGLRACSRPPTGHHVAWPSRADSAGKIWTASTFLRECRCEIMLLTSPSKQIIWHTHLTLLGDFFFGCQMQARIPGPQLAVTVLAKAFKILCPTRNKQSSFCVLTGRWPLPPGTSDTCPPPFISPYVHLSMEWGRPNK